MEGVSGVQNRKGINTRECGDSSRVVGEGQQLQ